LGNIDYRHIIKGLNANKRYIPVGGEAQFARLAISIKLVTAESDAIPNAARNIPPPLAVILKEQENDSTN
jgi:hypothetical protein